MAVRYAAFRVRGGKGGVERREEKMALPVSDVGTCDASGNL